MPEDKIEMQTPKDYDISANEIVNLQKIGININPEVKVSEKPFLNLFGTQETEEVIVAICSVVNLIMAKNGIMSYVALVPEMLTAYSGSEKIINELLDLSPEEYVKIKDTVRRELKFPAGDEDIEELVEKITYHVLGLVVAVLQYNNKKTE